MLKLRDIMTTDVLTLPSGTTLREAAEILARKHVSGAPVVDGGAVVGVVSATDLLAFSAASPGVPTERPLETELGDWEEISSADEAEKENEPPGRYFTELWADVGADVSERMQEVRSPEWDTLEEHTVDEVMSRRLWTLGPDEDVTQAAELMGRLAVHRVIVMDGKKLAGVVTASDIARAVADHKIGGHTYVFNPDQAFDDRGWK